ncbi:MAG: hypothetical protein GX605_07625, partial [Chloroflexi bacterium]|nr:hypothetical protein [Chloroflexota bacterium]
PKTRPEPAGGSATPTDPPAKASAARPISPAAPPPPPAPPEEGEGEALPPAGQSTENKYQAAMKDPLVREMVANYGARVVDIH